MMTSRNSQRKTFILATAGVAILAWAGITFLPTDSVTAKDDKLPSSGTLACTGFYTSNNQQKLRLIFVNHNADPIYIDGFRVYDWDGQLKWDSQDTTGLYGGTLPTDLNGLISDTDRMLEPYATAWYKSEQLLTTAPLPVFPPHTSQNQNHVKVHVDWHADTNVDSLEGRVVRHLHLGDGTPWGRSIHECLNI